MAWLAAVLARPWRRSAGLPVYQIDRPIDLGEACRSFPDGLNDRRDVGVDLLYLLENVFERRPGLVAERYAVFDVFCRVADQRLDVFGGASATAKVSHQCSAELGAQLRVFRFELSQPLTQWVDRLDDIVLSKPWNDMLLTIPVEGLKP